MNKLTRCLIAGTAMLGLSASCLAAGDYPPAPSDDAYQNCQCPPPRHKGWKHGEFGPEAKQKRLQKLHDSLNLSASQEKAWDDYVAVVNKHHGPRGERPRPPREEFEKMTAPERLEKLLEGMKRHEAYLQEKLDATKAFYAELNSSQKEIFDKEAVFHRPHHRRGPRGHRGYDGYGKKQNAGQY